MALGEYPRGIGSAAPWLRGDPDAQGCGAWLLRLAIIFLFVFVIFMFFAVAVVFLFVFFLVWLLSEEHIRNQPITRVGVGAFWMYSAHLQWYAL